MSYQLIPAPDNNPTSIQRASDRFQPLWITLAALLNGMRWVAGPGTGKTRGIALTVVWPHLWHGWPAIVSDPTGALCKVILHKVLQFGEEIQRHLWSRITYVDMAATDYIRSMPLYERRADETLFAIANRFPEMLKRLDFELTSAPILGWNSLFGCAIYAGQIAAALGRQLDFVADLIVYPQRYKEELRQALHRYPELAQAVSYFRQMMDPTSHSLGDRRTGSLLTKLVPFLANPLLLATFAGQGAGINWSEEVRQGHTVLLDFGGETDRERRQFKQIWCFLEVVEFLKGRGSAGRETPVLLVIDEVSDLLGPRVGDRSILGQDLHELITVWARNVGVKLCIAHQYPSQLEPTVNHALTQLGAQVIGNIQDPEDALYLARQFHPYDPALLRKTEPVWMNVQHWDGPWSYSVPEVIDRTTTEYTPDEQFLMVADAIRSLPRYHFLVRPALGEGNLTGPLRRMRLDRLDAGLYPDEVIVAEVRQRLRERDGIPVEQLLTEIEQRRQQAIPVSPVKAKNENGTLPGDKPHAHPVPTLYPPTNERKSSGLPDRRPNRGQRLPAQKPLATTRRGKLDSGHRKGLNRIRLSSLDRETLYLLATLGYMSTPQIVEARRLIAEEQGLPVAQTSAIRVVQRRLLQLVQADILRRIAQPIFPDEHTGSKPYVYALDRVGAQIVSDDQGVEMAEIDWKPKDAERRTNFQFIDHALAIGDFYLALRRACLRHQVALAQWTGDHSLRRAPARFEVTLENGRQATVTLVPDAFYQLVLPTQQAAWLFLEMDLGSMTIAPAHSQLRAWRRKFLAYGALAESQVLKSHYGASSMIVTVVTTSPTRAAHLAVACERAGGDQRFWFTSMDDMKTDQFSAIWRVAGKGETLYPLLPPR